MKQILLGTTALVAASLVTAPAMAAERIQLEIRGYHVGGISYSDGDFTSFSYDEYTDTSASDSGIGDYNEINFGSDSEVHFRGSTTLDNGLEVSFKAELELEDDADVDGDADAIDEVYIQFDGGFGRVQFGQNDGAMDQMAVVAPLIFKEHGHSDSDLDPFDSLGWGNPIDTVGDYTGDDIKLTYFTPSFNGLQIGASLTPNPCKNDTGYSDCSFTTMGRNYIEVSATWEMEVESFEFAASAGFGAGESSGSGEEPSEWTLGAAIETAGFTIGGSFKDTNTSGNSTRDETHWDAGISYETGPWSFNIAYGAMDVEYTSGGVRYTEEATSWIAGAVYSYGPGMQIGFGVTTLDASEAFHDPMDTYIDPDYYSYRESEGFEGTSFFVENSIKF